MRYRFPHLARCLIEHIAVTRQVFVLFHEISCAEDCFNIQIVDIIGYPYCLQFEQWLVYVVFYVALRIAKENHGERRRVVELLTVGPMLCYGSECGCAHKNY